MSSFLTTPRLGWLVVLGIVLVFMPTKVAAFGAGNIPSVAQVEGVNWRHGDVEDMLTTIAFLHGKKWTSMLIKRTYFGNWLRDYSQAVDVGSLKGVNAETIRILVWVLGFMAFGYATEEFEVTAERLGVYRAEEHIDNPLGYGEGIDARTMDPRLRGPVLPVETEIDMRTGMKNYIANETGQWATSSGYLRYSIASSVHYGRLYTSGGSGDKGNEDRLCEALRFLGQALHCMEDFSAHSNYCELALRELGHRNVFPHCGTQAEIHIQGKKVYPIVTGTFGGVDFLHSVIGEANDHFTQSEVDEVDIALKNAEGSRSAPSGDGSRGFFDSAPSTDDFISLVAKLPGIGDGMAVQASDLKAASEAQERENATRADGDNKPAQGSSSSGKPTNPNQIPGMSPDFDPAKVVKQIYPILVFRDKIVKTISRGIAKVPGLEKLLDHISETLTAFVLGLLAPFIRPIIKGVSKVLKDGSSGVISASSNSQLAPWENSHCTDPTHSMLSKDHFSNILNSCAGRVAATTLQHAVPRILYLWENTDKSVDALMEDLLQTFHHPALRKNQSDGIQHKMFETVKTWAGQQPHVNLDKNLNSDSVKMGRNHINHGTKNKSRGGPDDGCHGGHGKVSGSLWSQIKTRDLDAMEGKEGNPTQNYTSDVPASSQSQDFGKNPDYLHYDSQESQQPQQWQQNQGGPNYYNASTPQPSQYQSGAPPSSGQYQGYGGQQPYGGYNQGPNPGPGGPPPSQWGGGYQQAGYQGGYQGGPPPFQGGPPGGPPPSVYGSQNYGPPQGQGGYNQYPGQGQQGWNQYPGQGGGY